MPASTFNNDIDILLTALMNDYKTKISRTFNKQDYENFMKIALMETMKSYNMKQRGNIARLVAAVHIILSLSGFQPIYNHDENHEIFPDYWFKPSDLCYAYLNLKLERIVETKFSFDDINQDLVMLSGIYFQPTEHGSEVVHTTVLDLKKFASPLIECLHGAIADSSEIKLLELWSQVYTDICFPLLAELRYSQIILSEPFKLYKLVRGEFVDYVLDQNNLLENPF